MRIGVVSDIHSNLTALLTVLDDMGPVDALWCLGDFVGFGPWPNECIELLRERGVQAIAGNHDLAAIGTISSEEFNGGIAVELFAGDGAHRGQPLVGGRRYAPHPETQRRCRHSS